MGAPSQKPTPGTTFGRYRVLGELAAGGMAHVCLAEIEGPQGFRKRCVLKTMIASLAQDEAFVKMFVEEAGIAARFEHDNVVRIFDFGNHGGQYFIAMEHIAGRTLRQIARRYRDLGRRPELWFLVRVAMGVCDALDYVHNYSDDGIPLRLVHRDVSPENVMVSFNGTVKLLDFGVAHSSISTAASGMVVGKYRYMAPERLDGSVSGPSGDIYSLGMILYELLMGGSPFTGDEAQVVNAIFHGPPPLDQVAPDLPSGLRAVVARAIAPVGRRFESASRFKRHLRKALAEFAPDAAELSLADELAILFSTAVDLPSNVRAASRRKPSELPPPALDEPDEIELAPDDIEVAIDEFLTVAPSDAPDAEAANGTPTKRNDIDALQTQLEQQRREREGRTASSSAESPDAPPVSKVERTSDTPKKTKPAPQPTKPAPPSVVAAKRPSTPARTNAPATHPQKEPSKKAHAGDKPPPTSNAPAAGTAPAADKAPAPGKAPTADKAPAGARAVSVGPPPRRSRPPSARPSGSPPPPVAGAPPRSQSPHATAAAALAATAPALAAPAPSVAGSPPVAAPPTGSASSSATAGPAAASPNAPVTSSSEASAGPPASAVSPTNLAASAREPSPLTASHVDPVPPPSRTPFDVLGRAASAPLTTEERSLFDRRAVGSAEQPDEGAPASVFEPRSSRLAPDPSPSEPRSSIFEPPSRDVEPRSSPFESPPQLSLEAPSSFSATPLPPLHSDRESASFYSSREAASEPEAPSARGSSDGAPHSSEGADPFRVARVESGDLSSAFGSSRLPAAAPPIWTKASSPTQERPGWSPEDWGISQQAESPPGELVNLEASRHFDRGLAAMREGQYALAEIEWEQAVALDPENKSYTTNLKRLREKRDGINKPRNG